MAAPKLRPLRSRPESLTELVLESVRDAIVDKALPPGTRLSEAVLAAQLEVSKTPVREALLRLRHIGLVEPRTSGLHVVQPSRDMIQNAYELRVGLERTSALHAATRRPDSDTAVLAELAQSSLSFATAGNVSGFRDSDAKFHRLIARCSGNPALASAIDDALLLTSVLRLRDVPASGDSVECACEHVAIADAIAAREAGQAADAMKAHVEHVMATVLAVVGGRANDQRPPNVGPRTHM